MERIEFMFEKVMRVFHFLNNWLKVKEKASGRGDLLGGADPLLLYATPISKCGRSFTVIRT